MNIGMSTFRFLVRFFAKLGIINVRRRASHRISHLSETRLPSSFFFFFFLSYFLDVRIKICHFVSR
jgi:hypothetical protein